jgi:predicted nucleic acid-binding protein
MTGEDAVYVDATTLIGLARIDRLDLFRLLPKPIRVTRRVWGEVADNPRRAGVTALLKARDGGLVSVVDEGDPEAFPYLDPGESTVLSAAAAARGAVLIDERKARALVDSDPGLREAIPWVSGVLGLLLFAKRRGRIAAVRPVLDDLIAQSFRIGPTLYAEVLRQAGED